MKQVLFHSVLALMLFLGMAVGDEQQGVEDQVKSLLGKALGSESIEKARPYLNEARLLYAANRMRLTTLKAGFLGVDMDQVEGRIHAREAAAGDDSAAVRAIDLLSSCITRYDELADQASDDADQLRTRYRWGPTERSQRWREIKGYGSRATYAKAWCWYGIGLAEDGADRTDAMEEAIDLFRRFTIGGYQGSDIVADCLLGQAMCYYELNRHYELISWLEGQFKTGQIEQSPLWQKLLLITCRSYNELGMYLELELNCQDYFDNNSTQIQSQTDLQFAVMRFDALRFICRPGNPYASGYMNRLEQTGEALYTQGEQWQGHVLAGLADGEYDIPLARLARARKLLLKNENEPAAEQARKGLETAGPQTSQQVLTALRHTRCLALAGTEKRAEFARAVVEYIENAPQATDGEELAVLAIGSLVKAFTQGQTGPENAISLLDKLEDSYSSERVTMHSRYARAVFMIERKEFAQAMTILESIDQPADSIKLSFLYNKSLAAFKASELTDDQDQKTVLLDKSESAWQELANGLTEAKDNEALRQKAVQLGFVIAEEVFNTGTDVSMALQLCSKLQSLDVEDVLGDKLSALQIRVRAANTETGGLSEYLQELLAEDQVSVQVIRSLVQAGEAYASEKDGPQQQNTIFEVYEHALKLSQKASEQLDDDLMLRIRFGLAKAYSKVGKYEQALNLFDRIEETKAGQSVEVLAAHASALEGAGKFQHAADKWNVLAKGLPQGSEMWFQANYNLIATTYQAGRQDLADRMAKYFTVKHKQHLKDNWTRQMKRLREGWE
ncbi:Anaphase-promoting complex, cyclosome, subunit 3 [Anaerohalosphaera lusitana]|uniref:Anaphase-promoting complex, cyclosome, subunit 3 n=1 Tax=Anaerohalosphaera lusitana TaxID=1936003 RepID=A0A1U9NNH8_9BACT|nr:hypothetical protein [Anaerohalosphaera lusitana]AQT69502.1 Anaphase-promoting complex, cyclosome, subunit 3 [Anaerohalosphaera lusitana]